MGILKVCSKYDDLKRLVYNLEGELKFVAEDYGTVFVDNESLIEITKKISLGG